jgi:hypothetical protein
MIDAGTARAEDGSAEEPAADDAPPQACLVCGGAIADVLLSLGSIDCHDCRSGLRAA